MRGLQFILFLCGGVNANAERFGEYQQIASASGIIFFKMRSRHCAGDGKAKNRFGCIDAVPASKRETELRTNIPATLYYLIGDLGCQLIDWPPQNGNSQLRCAPHRVDVRYGVGGGDATKVIGVVDDRHEKVRRGEHRSIVVEYDCRSIVSGLVTYKQRWESVCGGSAVGLCENTGQHVRCDLAAASCAMAVLGKAYAL